jgi:hypothetical protein
MLIPGPLGPGAWLLQGATTEFFCGHSWIAHDLNHINPDVHAIWKTFCYSETPQTDLVSLQI